MEPASASALPPPLAPASVMLDDRSLDEFLVWAAGYAKELVYYDVLRRRGGDWTSFFTCDAAFLIARIGLAPAARTLARFQAKQQAAESTDPSDVSASLPRLKAMADELIELAVTFETWRHLAPSGLEIRRVLESAIATEVGPAIRSLKSYDLGAQRVLGDPLGFDYQILEQAWKLDSVQADHSAYEGRADLAAPIRRVSALFESVYRTLLRLMAQSGRWMKEVLTRYPRHEPHYALFLAFLRLFEYAQKEMNAITGRHLDFFYRKVLGLAAAPAQPDQVHLVLELAKHVDQHPLSKGTLLNAGKDATGKPLSYAVDGDTVLNPATVAEVQAFFVNRDLAAGTTSFHRSTVARSADGAGGAFDKGQEPRWKTFGSDPARPKSHVGLAIGSPMFFLAAGQRRIGITLEIEFDGQPPATLPPARRLFSAHLTTAKKWLPVPIDNEDGGGAAGVAEEGRPLSSTSSDSGGTPDGDGTTPGGSGGASVPIGGRPIIDIQGLGPKYSKRLTQVEVRTLADLSRVDPDQLAEDLSSDAIPVPVLWEARMKALSVLKFDPGVFGIPTLLGRTLRNLMAMSDARLEELSGRSTAEVRQFKLAIRQLQAALDEPVLDQVRLRDCTTAARASSKTKSPKSPKTPKTPTGAQIGPGKKKPRVARSHTRTRFR